MRKIKSNGESIQKMNKKKWRTIKWTFRLAWKIDKKMINTVLQPYILKNTGELEAYK